VLPLFPAHVGKKPGGVARIAKGRGTVTLPSGRNESQAMPDVHAAIDAMADAAAALFDQVRAATADVNGVTRDAFGAKETLAGEIMIDF
jgi:hypothetical protein